MSDVKLLPGGDLPAGWVPDAGAEPAGDQADPPGDAEERVDLEVNLEFPKRRVALGYGEQHVEVEGPDALAELAGLAERLWILSTPPESVRRALGAGSALITERSGD